MWACSRPGIAGSLQQQVLTGGALSTQPSGLGGGSEEQRGRIIAHPVPTSRIRAGASTRVNSRPQTRSSDRPGSDPQRMALAVLPPARILGGAARLRSPAASRQLFKGSVFLDSDRTITSVGVRFGELHPPALAIPGRAGTKAEWILRARRSQAVHSGATMRTMLVSLRKPVMRRSSTVTSPSFLASRMALRTVVSATPTIAAAWPTASRQSPRRAVSAAISASTACSARVNRAASPGGSRPEAAQRRRRSIEASERGREPTDRLALPGRAWGVSTSLAGCGSAGLGDCPMQATFPFSVRASIKAERHSASTSVICPSPNARQSWAVTCGSVIRLASSMARRILSANIPLGPLSGHDRSFRPSVRASGPQAKPHRCESWRFRLTPGGVSWLVRGINAGPHRPPRF